MWDSLVFLWSDGQPSSCFWRRSSLILNHKWMLLLQMLKRRWRRWLRWSGSPVNLSRLTTVELTAVVLPLGSLHQEMTFGCFRNQQINLANFFCTVVIKTDRTWLMFWADQSQPLASLCDGAGFRLRRSAPIGLRPQRGTDTETRTRIHAVWPSAPAQLVSKFSSWRSQPPLQHYRLQHADWPSLKTLFTQTYHWELGFVMSQRAQPHLPCCCWQGEHSAGCALPKPHCEFLVLFSFLFQEVKINCCFCCRL